MLYDNIDYTKLIRFSKDGLIIGSYTDIRQAITDRYKQIYGSDLDLSIGTLDGQFIEMLSLMFNNILNVTRSLYDSVDPNTAQGHALDVICSLSNVQRRPASYSTATLSVTNNDSNDFNDVLDVIDGAGNEWVSFDTNTNVEAAVEIPAGQTVEVIVRNLSKGAVAPIGQITKTAISSLLTISQVSYAIGQDEETDEHLRARRNASLSVSGLTTLESLQAKLLQLNGIEDVKIYNNNTTIEGLDVGDITVDYHDVYVCVRQNTDLLPDNADSNRNIGNIIYNSLTPGIRTTEYSGSFSTVADRSYIQNIYGVSQPVYWKKCVEMKPKLNVTIAKLPQFTTDTLDRIRQKLANYINQLPINSTLSTQELYVQVLNADPLFKGRATFTVSQVTVTEIDVNGTAVTDEDVKNNYFNLAEADLDTYITFTIS